MDNFNDNFEEQDPADWWKPTPDPMPRDMNEAPSMEMPSISGEELLKTGSEMIKNAFSGVTMDPDSEESTYSAQQRPPKPPVIMDNKFSYKDLLVGISIGAVFGIFFGAGVMKKRK